MELSNPINNQHMIEGLNTVLLASFQARQHCASLLKKSSDMNVRRVVSELEKAHINHIEVLGDAVRYLGGSPHKDSISSAPRKLRTMFFPFRFLRREEEQLIELCDKQIKYLTGSSEAADKLNLVKDDITACLYMTTGAKA